ncbi:GNAT family N-acetyltransferase [Daejeonella oryzae]|uniref:GNAT family N-acetyltransferase n=1 Tax=Daejeonella oryzae TaxID=1122943 RepID=UPI00042190FB|nr:GNAT family N-acetyltransferase [Daejeonella oryzae]
MIKFVRSTDVLPLRSLVLRNGKPLQECVFPFDDAEGSFHLANTRDHDIISVVTFHAANHRKFEGKGYQLRGMATLPEYQGKGAGNELVNFAITYLRGQNANYIWCNARKAALSFYKGLGFEIVSEEFEIEGIGAHYEMYLKIK